jgi:hypothetical protein
MRLVIAVRTAGGFSMSRSRIVLSLLVLALCVLPAVPAPAEVFHVTLTNGSVIDTAYQPQQSSWDPEMVLLLTDTGNWVGFHKDEIDSIQAEDPAQGFGVRISDKTIALGLSPNDLPVPVENGAQQAADRYYQLVERALAVAERQQSYSIQQGVSTEQTQGIPVGFGGGGYFDGFNGSTFNGLSGSGFGGLGGGGGGGTAAPPTPVTSPPDRLVPPNPER